MKISQSHSSGVLLILLSLLSLSACPAQDAGDSDAIANPGPVSDDPADRTVGAVAMPADEVMEPETKQVVELRGHLILSDESLFLKPCNANNALPVTDDNESTLMDAFEAFSTEKTPNVYVQLQVIVDQEDMRLSKLHRASFLHDSRGCSEDLSGLKYLARGNEPFWGVEVRSTDVVALLQPAFSGDGPDEQLYQSATYEYDGENVHVIAVNEEGKLIEVFIDNTVSYDSMSGEYFGMSALVLHDGRELKGSAWPGEDA